MGARGGTVRTKYPFADKFKRAEARKYHVRSRTWAYHQTTAKGIRQILDYPES